MMIKDSLIKFWSYCFIIVKLFVFISLFCGVFFGLFRSISGHSLNGFYDGIMFGILLSLITTPILTVLDIIQKIKCVVKYKSVNFTVKQDRRFSVQDEYETVFRKICDILSNNKKIELRNRDIAKGKIEALAKRSWKSFGEKIDIKLFQLSRKKVIIELSSKPIISLMIIDYCKNFENVETIIQSFKRQEDRTIKGQFGDVP